MAANNPLTIMDQAAKKKEGRVLLPSYFVPKRYTLSLEPDFEKFVFPGVCKIDFEVKAAALPDKEIHEVILHAQELQFTSAILTAPESAETKADRCSVQWTGEEKTVTFEFTSINLASLKEFSLKVHYQGVLNNQMAGFYRSNYTDIDGNTKVMASTQFESLDARRCFPCIDEPGTKSSFVASLTVPSHMTALSNMPVASSTQLSSDKTQYTFLETPVMSTYLLAFVIGEFDVVTDFTPTSKIQVSVYTPPGKADTGKFALQTALHNLETYNKFFDCPYPLPKCDMVAIPEFAAGAMENWGLVTYRQVDLLIDAATASNSQKQRVAIVVAHELAHQWFGNLVTMSWWDDLWLNEGFASWCENYATNELYPDYKLWDQFTVDALSHAMRLDSLRSSHPIQVPIRHAVEVEQVFDAISYCKGASVVRMCAAVLGMDNFQKGLQAYMKDFAYKNTETFDLWQAWHTASGMPVAELMASWTEQMGFPYVKVISEDWKDDSVTFQLEQAWFLADGGDESTMTEEEKAKTWAIPIMTCTRSGVSSDVVLMREKTATITLKLGDADDWVKLNAGQQVPMRVLLTPTMIKRLEPAIQSKVLSAIDRASLVNDAYALVKAGHMPPKDLIELLVNYKDEGDYIVWNSLSAALNGLDSVLSDDEGVSAKFQEFAKSLILPLVEKVGWSATANDDHLTTLLRGVMINLLSSFCASDKAVHTEAKRRFDLFWENPLDVEALPSDYRASVFSIVLQNGDESLYHQIKSYYTKAHNNAESKLVLNSLGSIADPALKWATMEWSTSGEIKLQDFFYVMGSVSRSNKVGRDTAWKYFQENFEKIKGMLATASPSLMNAVIVLCCGGGASHEKADAVENFFKANPVVGSDRRVAQTVEGLRANAKFCDSLMASPLKTQEDFWSTVV